MKANHKHYTIMKRILPILLLIIGLATTLNAQWVSPGNGTTYTLPDLVDVTEGVVTNGPDGFLVNADLTISTNDILKIDNQVARIDVDNALITINGSMVCTNNSRVKLYGLNETKHFSMRFENATDCYINKMYLSDGAGIKIIESNVTFNDVKFVYFTRDYSNAVIDILNCDPVISDCYFMLNHGAAISSPANGQASPQIMNCQFDTNVTDNQNTPQINLGPGGNDTIRIVGNEVYTIMAQWYVGGVSVADLMGTGSTKVLLKDNIIKEGRYGYNQQGANISSVITGNQFIDNNHEDNPMNGGSGISIYGSSTNNKAILRNNLITGNLWGITAIYYHDIDMGTEDDWGYNEIHDNGNGGTVYDLYNNASYDIMAVGNKWGSTDYDEIESHIYHQADDPSLGLVTFYPYVGSEGVEEYNLESTEIDLTKATIFTLTGQRVNYSESLTPGVYLVITEHGTKKIFIQ